MHQFEQSPVVIEVKDRNADPDSLVYMVSAAAVEETPGVRPRVLVSIAWCRQARRVVLLRLVDYFMRCLLLSAY